MLMTIAINAVRRPTTKAKIPATILANTDIIFIHHFSLLSLANCLMAASMLPPSWEARLST